MATTSLYGTTAEEAEEMLKRGKLTITVVGQGKLGLPLALVFASKGAKVYGLDVNPRLVDMLRRGDNPLPREPGVGELLQETLNKGLYRPTTSYEKSIPQSDLIVFLVPVYADKERVRLEPLLSAVEKMAPLLKRGSILVTETTLPPGTTESLIPLVEEKSGLRAGRDFGIAHAPERTMSGRMIRDITESYPKIIGALDNATLEPLKGVYGSINRRGVIPVSSIRVAEAVKVFEGVYRDVNIALANELALISEKMGIDALEAIRVANTQPYSHIHKPGAGVGGHCIPVYPWFLIHRAPDLARLLKTARDVNDDMPRRVALLTAKALNKAGRPTRGSRVLLHGLAFRNGVKEHANSPTFTLYRELVEEWGVEAQVEDPLYTRDEVRSLGLKPFDGDYHGLDALVIVTDHEEYRRLPLKNIAEKMRTRVLVDARYLFTESRERRLYYYAAPGLGIQEPREDA